MWETVRKLFTTMEFDYRYLVLKENAPEGGTRQVDEGEIASRRSGVKSSLSLVQRFAALGSGAQLHPRGFPLIAFSTSASGFGCMRAPGGWQPPWQAKAPVSQGYPLHKGTMGQL